MNGLGFLEIATASGARQEKLGMALNNLLTKLKDQRLTYGQPMDVAHKDQQDHQVGLAAGASAGATGA